MNKHNNIDRALFFFFCLLIFFFFFYILAYGAFQVAPLRPTVGGDRGIVRSLFNPFSLERARAFYIEPPSVRQLSSGPHRSPRQTNGCQVWCWISGWCPLALDQTSTSPRGAESKEKPWKSLPVIVEERTSKSRGEMWNWGLRVWKKDNLSALVSKVLECEGC